MKSPSTPSSTTPSAYTKYHKKYHHENKNKINQYRMRKYYQTTYGIPVERGDLLSAFYEHKPFYLKLKHIAQQLRVMNPELVELIMSSAKSDAEG